MEGYWVALLGAACRSRKSRSDAHVSEPMPTSLPPLELARMIDHTLLRADATQAEIAALCGEAREHGFAADVKVIQIWQD